MVGLRAGETLCRCERFPISRGWGRGGGSRARIVLLSGSPRMQHGREGKSNALATLPTIIIGEANISRVASQQ